MVLFERAWLDRFLAALPTAPRILDLGCGTGVPVSRFLTDRGAALIGLDYSSAMIDLARHEAPDGDWRLGDMRDLSLDESFDGVLSWDGFFHLTQIEQRAVLPKIASLIRVDGALLLTVGPEEGEVAGMVGGEAVYHASLSPEDYDAILKGLGFKHVVFTPDDPDCDGHSILLATGKAA